MSGDGYTNLEKYLNGIDPTRRLDYTKPENNKNPFHTPAGARQGDKETRRQGDGR